MAAPDPSAEFRRKATTTFHIVFVALFAIAIGIAALGWFLGHWWGLAIGGVVALVVLVVGLSAATLLYALTQDGA